MDRIIYIGADIVPTESNYSLFKNGNIERLIGKDLVGCLAKSDFTILNLEVPLVDKKSEISKCGPCLIAPTDTIVGLKAINPFFYTLANNHILDQGVQGLTSTQNVLKENSIDFSGIGRNLSDASQSYIKDISGIKIGIYCCTEHEFSIATESSPGANPFDPLYSFEHVSLLKRQVDIVIVLYHGGKEHYRYPSPRLKKVFHKFAEEGADYVIAQHSHCIGCMEKYLGSILLYGQGNFLFDNSNHECWKTSFLFKIIIPDNLNCTYEFIPCVKMDNGVRRANKSEGLKMLNEFIERSNRILEEQFVRDKFKELAKLEECEYYWRLLGGVNEQLPFKVLNRLSHGKLIRKMYSKEYVAPILNCVNCEAHSELLSTLLHSKLEEQ